MISHLSYSSIVWSITPYFSNFFPGVLTSPEPTNKMLCLLHWLDFSLSQCIDNFTVKVICLNLNLFNFSVKEKLHFWAPSSTADHFLVMKNYSAPPRLNTSLLTKVDSPPTFSRHIQMTVNMLKNAVLRGTLEQNQDDILHEDLWITCLVSQEDATIPEIKNEFHAKYF